MPNNREAEQPAQTPDKRRVFVVHGRNILARDAVFELLRAIDLYPIEWEEAIAMTGNTSPSTLTAIERAFANAQAALVILTGDDLARLGKRYLSEQDEPYEHRLTRQARPNVIFEAGMAFGNHPGRTVIVSFGKTRPISDIAGTNILYLSDSPESRQKLAGRLKNAGCAADTENKSDWLKAGDFGSAFHEPDQVSGNAQAGLTITRRRADPEEKANYKPKVWVDIRNDSGACLTIRHMGWSPTRAGISIKYGPPSMQLKIGRYWCPEKEGVEQLHVPSGETLRTWVQPAQQHDMKDLEQRCESEGKIGNLLLRVDDINVQIPV
jgi:predicted nucleotide-binding protein